MLPLTTKSKMIEQKCVFGAIGNPMNRQSCVAFMALLDNNRKKYMIALLCTVKHIDKSRLFKVTSRSNPEVDDEGSKDQYRQNFLLCG